jgi:hypothetical protein
MTTSKTWKNKEFKQAIDSYCEYVDSVGFKPNFDYIYIEALKSLDSTVFFVYLVGGAYDFLVDSKKIVDFIIYNKNDIMFIGDFPNDVVEIKKNKRLNIIDDILKVRYPNDYNKYLQDKHSVGPLIYDSMNMTLVFKKNKLISCKRQYY